MTAAAAKNTRYLPTFFSHLLFVVISLSLFTACESRKTIVNNLDEKEANGIVVFLSTKGVDAFKVRNTEGSGGAGAKAVLWDISVPAEQAIEAMSILNQAA